MMQSVRRRPAFTLTELLLVVAMIALLVSLVLPSLHEARRSGRSAVCLSNLRQHGVGTQSYANTFEDAIWTFSWTRGQNVASAFGPAATPLHAAQDQAITILRRRADRHDIPRSSGAWLPHMLYSQLVLLDYLDQRVADPMVACPEDRQRIMIQSDIRGFESGYYQPCSPQKYWPYSSSYQVTAAVFDRGQSRDIRNVNQQRVAPGMNMTSFLVGNDMDLGPSRLTDVAYPGQKVHVHEFLQRHAGREHWVYALPESVSLVLHFDGSAGVRRGMDSNPGWQPRTPAAPAPLVVYQPPAWEGKSKSPQNDMVYGRHRWTRGGLRGVDFRGTEISTGQQQ